MKLTMAAGAEPELSASGASGGAWPMPAIAVAYFISAGGRTDLIRPNTGFSRDDVDAYAVQSQQRAAKAGDEGASNNSVVPVTEPWPNISPRTSNGPTTTMQSLRPSCRRVRGMGQMGGLDAVAIQ